MGDIMKNGIMWSGVGIVLIFFSASALRPSLNGQYRNSVLERCSSASSEGADGVRLVTQWLNTVAAKPLMTKFAERDTTLKKEMDKANFWTGGSFVVEAVRCESISAAGLNLVRTTHIINPIPT